MYSTFNPEHTDDGYDEMRWHHVECEDSAEVSAVHHGSEGGTGSDAGESAQRLTGSVFSPGVQVDTQVVLEETDTLCSDIQN